MLFEGCELIKDEDYVRDFPRTLTYVLKLYAKLSPLLPFRHLFLADPIEGHNASCRVRLCAQPRRLTGSHW